MTLFLNEHEVIELTQKRRHDAQVRALRHMGIEHKERADGSVAVLKAHVNEIFGSHEKIGADIRIRPNFEGINGQI